MTLKEKLQSKLKGAGKVTVLGVGSQLRADDAAGMLVASYLQKSCKKYPQAENLQILFGETAPENLTGEIKAFKPTHLIIVDAADTGKRAGTALIMEPGELAGISFCTHQLPMNILTDYLLKSFKCEIIIVGIQPKTLVFGKSVSRSVKAAAKEISATIKSIILTSARGVLA
ncbi:MAG: hydrogenase maturation peptidase HycI [Candidatus Omnitrophica bacterium]|nr:hydrogenase maturation peptidase HycI [Candidatus Omnitrophota bacterium]